MRFVYFIVVLSFLSSAFQLCHSARISYAPALFSMSDVLSLFSPARWLRKKDGKDKIEMPREILQSIGSPQTESPQLVTYRGHLFNCCEVHFNRVDGTIIDGKKPALDCSQVLNLFAEKKRVTTSNEKYCSTGRSYALGEVEYQVKEDLSVVAITCEKSANIEYGGTLWVRRWICAPEINIRGGKRIQWVYRPGTSRLKQICKRAGIKWKKARDACYCICLSRVQQATLAVSESITLGNIEMPNADVILTFDDVVKSDIEGASRQEASCARQKTYTVNLSNIGVRSLKIVVPRDAKLVSTAFDVHIAGKQYTNVMDFVEFTNN